MYRLGQMRRMESDKVVKRMLDSIPDGKRKFGRPKLRRLDVVTTDLKTFDINNGESVAQDRDGLNKVVLGVRDYKGLYSRW